MHQDVYHQEQIVRQSQERSIDRARRFGTLDFYTREERTASRSRSENFGQRLRRLIQPMR
jgi:hypothetical protein